MTFAEIAELLGTPFMMAVLFATLTASALSLMTQQRKDTLALWLMGEGNENWAHHFNAMFDGLFGSKHFSVVCLLRSAVASVAFVVVIWWLMSWSGSMGRILLDGTSLVVAVTIGIAVNIVADYFSLLETRVLLGQLAKLRSPLAHVLILIVDAVLTAVIILAVIWIFQQSGVLELAVPEASRSAFADSDPLVIALAFSVFSPPFYSTFLTSVWIWFYVLAVGPSACFPAPKAGLTLKTSLSPSSRFLSGWSL